jgi:hypothetical protein
VKGDLSNHVQRRMAGHRSAVIKVSISRHDVLDRATQVLERVSSTLRRHFVINVF